MDVIPLLVFCSLVLAGIGVLLFVGSTRNRDHEHADRLALLPLEEDLLPRNAEQDESSSLDSPGTKPTETEAR